ncbi:family 10 glycosylhydrolase [Belliella sp. R4-6]|uniref:Family 10 glycosylhydrolase n=1 Tax=Belliella alkalica TaxID=1730871 RepID=A0ABS9VEX5_9BACT|nr:family 10 glycosylhydrolase [Belliella alkalica]MCH7414987.1 family 10 glycosylhydrolase [Belliella alkalica]
MLPKQNGTLPEGNKESFYTVSEIDLNQENREFRGVWIATVANIDWPKLGTDTWDKQKADFLALLDYYQGLNFNAVIVQIRAAGDAFYPSRYAPWSRYLTGQEGVKPKTLEDPLSWMILQAHLRGFEFHAWLNPYRATFDLNVSRLSIEHDFFLHRDWMIQYGSKFYYNPGIPEVRSHLLNIIEEVVKNYDIDAIHFDDYFYPYKIENQVFSDESAYRKYGIGKSLDDWRRENVNLLIKEVHQKIKITKPWVQFGISPFGVWRNSDKDPNGSNTKGGVTNYDDLYADPIAWMKNKWVDYLIPQLYWSMDYKLASHKELVMWWSKNSHNTKIYVGNGPYKIRDNSDLAWNDPNELSKQVSLAKSTSGIEGNAYFSARSLYAKNTDVAQMLLDLHYKSKVLTPSFDKASIETPIRSTQIELISRVNGLQLFMPNSVDPNYRFAIVYSGNDLQDIAAKKGYVSRQQVYLSDKNRYGFVLDSKTSDFQYIVVSFIDRFGRESKAKVFELKSK